MEITEKICREWFKNKSKNPISNYTIKENGPMYKKLQKNCKKYEENVDYNNKQDQKTTINISNQKALSSSPSPSSSSSSKNTSFQFSESSPYRQESPHDEFSNTATYYPEITDLHFSQKLQALKEYAVLETPEIKQIETLEEFENKVIKECPKMGFNISMYQYFLSQYISPDSPYKSILVYHSVGLGKTCSAVTIAESFLENHQQQEDGPSIWVILPASLKKTFKEGIFEFNISDTFQKLQSQCTGDKYLKLGKVQQIDKKDKETFNSEKKRIDKIIKNRYFICTYDEFVSFVDKETKKTTPFIVQNKVIIIDEAHHLRNNDSDEMKTLYNSISNVVENGINNKLILLSATPMYNEPDEIIDLIKLLMKNDKLPSDVFDIDKLFEGNKITQDKIDMLKQTATRYISYIKSNNPFTFATRLKSKYTIPMTYFEDNFPSISSSEDVVKSFKWISEIKDGIVGTELGNIQKKLVETLEEGQSKQKNFFNFEAFNISYVGNTSGKKGFYNTFKVDETTSPFTIEYKNTSKEILNPKKSLISSYANKFKTISDIISNSEGIVLIYSRFIWSGVLPMAITLEHMGFSRYGTKNLLKSNTTNGSSHKYAILSSSNSFIMGKTKLEDIVKIANLPNNRNGEKIKIILMTQVASEGKFI
jgi:hypothetical protein